MQRPLSIDGKVCIGLQVGAKPDLQPLQLKKSQFWCFKTLASFSNMADATMSTPNHYYQMNSSITSFYIC
jgi:hypothetical protein